LTLTLDPAIRHTVVHHSSTSTYIPNFIEIEETFCGRTDGRTHGHFSPSNIIRSTFGSRPKKYCNTYCNNCNTAILPTLEDTKRQIPHDIARLQSRKRSLFSGGGSRGFSQNASNFLLIPPASIKPAERAVSWHF